VLEGPPDPGDPLLRETPCRAPSTCSCYRQRRRRPGGANPRRGMPPLLEETDVGLAGGEWARPPPRAARPIRDPAACWPPTEAEAVSPPLCCPARRREPSRRGPPGRVGAGRLPGPCFSASSGQGFAVGSGCPPDLLGRLAVLPPSRWPRVRRHLGPRGGGRRSRCSPRRGADRIERHRVVPNPCSGRFLRYLLSSGAGTNYHAPWVVQQTVKRQERQS